MIYIKLLILFIVWILMTISTGCALIPLINRFVSKEGDNRFLFDNGVMRIIYCAGGLTTILMGCIVCGVCALFAVPATAMIIVLAVVQIAIILYDILRCRNMLKEIFKFRPGSIRVFAGKPSENILCALYYLGVIGQIAFAMLARIDNKEIMRPAMVATKVFDTGILVLPDAVMSLIGSVAKITAIHPLVVINCLLPIVIIPLLYSVYRLLAGEFFTDRVYEYLFGIVIVILHFTGYYSDAAIPVTLLLCWYSGYVYVAEGICPFVLFLLLRRATNKPCKADSSKQNGENTNDTDSEEYMEEWDMKKHPIVNARNLAIGLGVLAVILAVLVFMLNRKINSLYDATANMQVQLNSQCSIHEFITESGNCEGYLLKDSAGNLTMIGGGDAKDGEELYDFLEGYGTSLDAWYLYGNDESDNGAYKYCTENRGIEVGEVYVLERTDGKN